MSINKFGPAGFGVGAFFGTPITIAVAPTTTIGITGTAYVAGQQYLMGNQVSGALTGVQLQAVTTSGGVTGTYTIFSGTGGHFYNDNASFQIVNTTTTFNICLIPT